MEEVGLESIYHPLLQKKGGQMAGPSQHCHEFSGSVKGEESLE